MSLRGFERAARRFGALGIPWLALGGGGYDVSNVVRAWTLAWSTMLDESLPDEIPASWKTEAAAYGINISSLRGPQEPPQTASHILEALDRTIEAVHRTVFPVLEEARRAEA
jgi:acetoin utilization protein AcuC